MIVNYSQNIVKIISFCPMFDEFNVQLDSRNTFFSSFIPFPRLPRRGNILGVYYVEDFARTYETRLRGAGNEKNFK